MSCFPCFSSNKSKKSNSFKKEQGGPIPQENIITRIPVDIKKPIKEDPSQVDPSNIQAQNFTFRELATATKNFRQECLMGEGGFGRVYKGTIPATGQVVAVKQLDRNGMQGGSKEFLVEVLMLSLLHHENLVKLVGYCADGDQRLLVYEFLPGGSLEHCLFESRQDDGPPLDWYNRMKIASSAAKGLWYLHDRANPPVIYRDLKSSNILLDNEFNAKLSDYGLAKLAGKDKMNMVPTRVMGTYGYSAPEYVRTGNLTLKSDVYSFGVVLLELITGRKAVDTTRPNDEQNLVSWAQPIFRDPKRYGDMADPLLNKNYPDKDLNQVVAIAAMCLQEEPVARPLMSDVVTALSFLSTSPPEGSVVHAPEISLESKNESEEEEEEEEESGKDTSDSSDEEDSSYHKDKNNDVETTKKQVLASAKYQESDVSDGEVDYYQNENQHDYSPQDTKDEYYSKSSRKSSTRSKNGANSSCRRSSSFSNSDSEDGINRSSSHKSSRKSSHGVANGNVSKKGNTKSSLTQKSSKKSSLSQKSSKKSVRVLSHKTSTGMGSEDVNLTYYGNASISRNSSSSEESHNDEGDAIFDRSESRPSHGNMSSGLFSIDQSVHSDYHYSMNGRSEEGSSSMHILDHTSSSASDEESDHHH